MRASPKARHAKSKARLSALKRCCRSRSRRGRKSLRSDPAGSTRLGDNVVIAEKLRKGYGDRLLFDDLSFRLPRGGIVGSSGPTALARRRCSA